MARRPRTVLKPRPLTSLPDVLREVVVRAAGHGLWSFVEWLIFG